MTGEIEYRAPLNAEELQAAFALREQVFIKEEGRQRSVETDEHDAHCQHFVAVQKGEVIGVLRCYRPDPAERSIKIGRVAVRKDRRGQGIGRGLMLTAQEWAALRCRMVYLHAQAGVQEFYAKLGYVSAGEEFMESGTPHVFMWRALDGPDESGAEGQEREMPGPVQTEKGPISVRRVSPAARPAG